MQDKEFINQLKANHSLINSRSLFFDACKQMDLNLFITFTGGFESKPLSQYTKKELLNERDCFGNNLLHMAEVVGCEEVALYLCLKAPELMEQKNNFGQYPVHFAVTHAWHLRKYPSHFLFKKDDRGCNTLHIAAARAVWQNVDYLLEAGLNANLRHNLDSLPLHCSTNHYDKRLFIKKSKIYITNKLIQNIGEVEAKKQFKEKNLLDMSPLDWAEETMSADEVEQLWLP